MNPARRMTKDQRRIQLLENALAIVREEGTEALTLARLAERAGVTKPIAYEHFGTRAGLLIALFRDYDDQTTESVHVALQNGGESIEHIAAILSAAYVDSCLAMGPEMTAIYNALSANEETASFRQSWREFLVDEFRTAFSPFVKLLDEQSTGLYLGFVGAAETVSEAAAAGRYSRQEAVSILSRIMTATLTFEAAQPRKVTPKARG